MLFGSVNRLFFAFAQDRPRREQVLDAGPQGQQGGDRQQPVPEQEDPAAHPDVFQRLPAQHARRAVAQAPDYAEAQLDLGRVLKEQQRLEEAIVQFEKAIELDSRYAAAYAGCSSAYGQMYQLIAREDRAPLPAGDRLTWGAITEGTVLAGFAYPIVQIVR